MSTKEQVWGSHLQFSATETNVLFCAGRDVLSLPMADHVLLPYDIWTNRSHCIMLYEEKIIVKETAQKILSALHEIEQQMHQGEFQLDPAKEDVHYNIESFVTQTQGVSIGGSMHTGRSRNDQTSCDIRLFLRQECLHLSGALLSLCQVMLKQASQHLHTTLPGFTHHQPAMITTWGHWLCSYVQSILRDLERIEHAYSLVNRNPLGAAASFGTSWSINRERTTELLGFAAVEINTLDCISSRWENEAQVAQVYGFLMNHLSIIAQDLLFLSLPYIQMIQIHDSFVTGSSIMPQKKNPDFAEVIKSKASFVHGNLASLFSVSKGNISGYNRDSQMTKYIIMDIIRECKNAPEVLQGVFETLTVFPQTMQRHCQTGFLNAVDLADYLAKTHSLSFRECYELLSIAVKYSEKDGLISSSSLEKAIETLGLKFTLDQKEITQFSTPSYIVAQRTHTGSPNPKKVEESIAQMNYLIHQKRKYFQNLQQQIDDAQQYCVSYQVG